MSIEKKAAYLAAQGITIMHLYDAMDLNGLKSVEAAVAYIFQNRFGHHFN